MKKVKGKEEREIRSSLLILDLRGGKLYDSGKQGGKTFHRLQVIGMNHNLWDRVGGLGSKICKGNKVWVGHLVFLERLRGA